MPLSLNATTIVAPNIFNLQAAVVHDDRVFAYSPGSRNSQGVSFKFGTLRPRSRLDTGSLDLNQSAGIAYRQGRLGPHSGWHSQPPQPQSPQYHTTIPKNASDLLTAPIFTTQDTVQTHNPVYSNCNRCYVATNVVTATFDYPPNKYHAITTPVYYFHFNVHDSTVIIFYYYDLRLRVTTHRTFENRHIIATVHHIIIYG